MRVLVCGDRHWGKIPVDSAGLWVEEYAERVRQGELHQLRLKTYLIEFDAEYGIDVIIEGEAAGADKLSRVWGEERDITVEPYPAKWAIYGRGAGPERNTQMLEEGEPDHVIAFHDDIMHSRGTADMVRQSRRRKVPIDIVSIDDVELVRYDED